VWGIEGIIVALMNRSKVLQGTAVAEFIKRESQPKIDAEADQRYSEVLREWVTECTKYWPKERIGLRDLLGRIEAHTGVEKGEKKEETGLQDLARGMRKARHKEGDGELELLWPENDLAENGKFARQALEKMEAKK
jgi:hypothetical protein